MSSKRILIYTTYFYPENFKVNEAAFDLAKKGFDVTVVTGIPNYPKGKFFEGYGLFKKRREIVNGVKVIRLPLIPRGSGKALGLILNYLSLAIVSFFHAFYLGFTQKFDCIFVHQLSPIFVGIPPIVVKKIQKIKIVFWNLECWPEVVVAVTDIRNPFFFKAVLSVVKFIYKHIDLMLIGSKEYFPLVLERGVKEANIRYFPNWAEEIFFNKDKAPLPFAFPKGFSVVFAGNLGAGQDFGNVVKSIELLRNEAINWVIVGDGRKKAWIENELKEKMLTEKVYFPGSFDIKYMPAVFEAADLLLLSLVDEPLYTIPSKLQAYMSSGTPIVGMLNDGGNALIKEVDCGRSCAAGDYENLAKNILEIYNMSVDEQQRLGKNALDYCEMHFNQQRCLDNLSTTLEAIINVK